MKCSSIQILLFLVLYHVNFISSRHTIRTHKTRLLNKSYEIEYDDPDDIDDGNYNDDDDSYTINVDVGKYGGLRRNGEVIVELSAPACLALSQGQLAHIVPGDDNMLFAIRSHRFNSQFLSFQVVNCFGGEVPGIISILVNGNELCMKPRVTKPVFIPVGQSKLNSKALRAQPVQYELPKCGRKVLISSKTLENGDIVNPGAWPWHVDIYLNKGIDAPFYRCSGTLVSEDTVVTAARCVIENDFPTPVTELQVIAGKTLLVGNERHAQQSEVVDVIIHPKFNSTCLANNIAIIKLKSDISFDRYIQPACLWEEDDVTKAKIYHQLGMISGWNFQGNKSVSNKLTVAKYSVANDYTCLSTHQQFSELLDGQSFCAGTLNGVKCNLDTGSGFLLPKLFRIGKELQEVWYLRGISSTRPIWTKTGSCDPRQLGLYTDVAQYTAWIQNYL